MATNKKPTQSLKKEALALIDSEYTLTLATSGEEGPWSTPVYYVLYEGVFYFFSSPSSRHIQQALDSGYAAASLYHQAPAWESIRGLQISGRVKQVRSLGTAAKAIARYLKRYPFTRAFFPEDPAPTLDSFSKRFKARLYAFISSDIYYTDNRFGFGTRKQIDAQELFR